jgi:hypothetical protein
MWWLFKNYFSLQTLDLISIKIFSNIEWLFLVGKKIKFSFFFFFLIQISFAQLSNDKHVFDLNDPRNPECPCHKYQKMADDEFEKLKKSNALNQSETITEIGNNQQLNVSKIQIKVTDSVSSDTGSYHLKKKNRKRITYPMFKRHYFAFKFLKTHKYKPSYSVCFKW